MPELLATADALLLPFSFDGQEREVVSTSYPSKTADYLASGAPVLVHAPPYSSIARAAREEGWAEVVDAPDAALLVRALERLETDGARRRELASRALRVARERHDLKTRRAEFVASIRGGAGAR
jgi:glycosyltransferase involved in cell wall biosynthesis